MAMEAIINRQKLTIGVKSGCVRAVENEGAIFQEEGHFTGAPWSARQPYHKGVCAWVTTALKHPVKQVHSMSLVYLCACTHTLSGGANAELGGGGGKQKQHY